MDVVHIMIAVAAFVGIFLAFLVISKTMNNIANQLAKLAYLLDKDQEYRRESFEIQRVLAQQAIDEAKRQTTRSDAREARDAQRQAAKK